MAVAAEIIYTVSDDSAEDGTTAIKIPGGFTLVQYGEFAAAMATLVDKILSGIVMAAALVISVDLSGLSFNLLDDSSDVEEIGAFQFSTTEGRPVRMNLPGIFDNSVLSQSDDLDQSNPAIAAIIAAMESGIAVTGGTIAPCDVGEDSISILEYARERFRPSGRRN